jgi:hypothetical protein
MGTKQHLSVVQFAHLVVIDGNKSHLAQAFALHTVVHNIAQTVKGFALSKLFFGFLDSGGNSEAETTAVIYFDNHE